ncbi:MAG: deacylase [Chloroflexi bacterium RBG_16_54_11]|nr:MAG: deacylase [Chloroflexi bacterium RBG_16_54_11]
MFPAASYLTSRKIPFTVANFPSTTPKGAASVALALGLREHQAVKTLIFEADNGELVLVMVGGDKNVISGHLKKVVGSRNVQLANPETVFRTTGYQIGSIPPFSWQPEGYRSFLDLALTFEAILAVGAGVWGNEILMTPGDLIKACSAQVVNLTDREKTIFPAG